MSKLHESIIADLKARLAEYEQKYVHQDVLLDMQGLLAAQRKAKMEFAESVESMRAERTKLYRQVADLSQDAERWRKFEEAGHLMIVDFERRESGSFKSTKRSAVDAMKGGD